MAWLKNAMDWFKNYEFVAIWLEGIALVAIFILDFCERRDQRRDREQQHRETLTQLRIAQKQADALVSSERAWVMIDAQRPGKAILTGVTGTDVHTSIPIDLVCTNTGKTPAWITEKRLKMTFVDEQHPLPQHPDLNIDILNPEPQPLQVGKPSRLGFIVKAEGQQESGKMLVIYGVVQYLGGHVKTGQ